MICPQAVARVSLEGLSPAVKAGRRETSVDRAAGLAGAAKKGEK